MRKLPSLAAIIPPTRARILTPVYFNPDNAWNFWERLKHLHVRHAGIQRELMTLAKAGYLVTWRDGS